jgi:hypothetical protein
MPTKLVEGRDYYVENGKYVFTSAYHLKRGYCCNSRCRHCPYKPGLKGLVAVDITGIDALGPLPVEAPKPSKLGGDDE